MKIDLVTIEGKLEIQGVYNYNGKAVDTEYDNHIVAKKSIDGIDYTSSRCLRHEMFKDIQPKQPRRNDFKEKDNFYVSLAASEIGLLRGIMSPEEGANSLKRNSPLSVLDAYTITDKSVIVFDQGSSSKPKESDKDKSDTSMFSKDNAPKRDQALKMLINICGLQFITQDPNDYSIVLKSDEELFRNKLSETFAKLGLNNQKFKFKDFKYQGGLEEIKTRGILFDDHQTSYLVIDSIKRIANIYASKTGAYIRTKDLLVKLHEKNNVVNEFAVSELDKNLKNVEFKKYFIEA